MCPLPIPRDVVAEISRLRAAGETVDSIRDAINAGFQHPQGKEFSRNTVHNYTKKYDAISAEERRLDQPVSWNTLGEDFGIPWDDLPFLLQVWAFWIGRPPLAREVLWWWKIHKAVPDAPENIVWAVTIVFTAVERYEKTTGQATDWAPDWAFLAFKPWFSHERHKEYESQLAQGLIRQGHLRISEVGDQFYLQDSYDEAAEHWNTLTTIEFQ